MIILTYLFLILCLATCLRLFPNLLLGCYLYICVCSTLHTANVAKRELCGPIATIPSGHGLFAHRRQYRRYLYPPDVAPEKENRATYYRLVCFTVGLWRCRAHGLVFKA